VSLLKRLMQFSSDETGVNNLALRLNANPAVKFLSFMASMGLAGDLQARVRNRIATFCSSLFCLLRIPARVVSRKGEHP
jgi:hypothetical protein